MSRPGGVRTAAAAVGGLALLLAPAGAEARRRPKARVSTVRAEENPKLKGDAKAFAKVQIALAAPADLAVLEPAPEAVGVEVRLAGYALRAPAPAAAETPPPAPRPQPYALLIVDNEVALRIDDETAPLTLRGLKPGPHVLRLVLSRPWGEVVKAPGAFALTRFWLGPRLEGKAGRAAEAAVWPDPRKPILTYVFPLGDPREDDPQLAPAAGSGAGAGDPAPAQAATTTQAAAPTPPPPRLDFFLSGATLRRRGRGDKLRVVIDKKEHPLIREWKPAPLKLRPGEHQITIDLLDRRGTKVRNAVNRSDRTFTLPAAE